MIKCQNHENQYRTGSVGGLMLFQRLRSRAVPKRYTNPIGGTDYLKIETAFSNPCILSCHIDAKWLGVNSQVVQILINKARQNTELLGLPFGLCGLWETLCGQRAQ